MSAHIDALRARVQIVGLSVLHVVEPDEVADGSEELVLFAHNALAVHVGPLVELLVEDALEAHVSAEAGRDEQRLRVPVERVLRVVVYEDEEAALVHLATLLVGQAGVELNVELVADAGVGRPAQRVRVVAVSPIELIAVEMARMIDPREVARLARHSLILAREQHVLHRVAERALLVLAQVAPRGVERVTLESQNGAPRLAILVPRHVGVRHELHGLVARQLIHIAYGDGGKERLVFAEYARARRDAVAEVGQKGVRGQAEEYAPRDDEYDQPHDAHVDVVRAKYVGQAVDLDQPDVFDELGARLLASPHRHLDYSMLFGRSLFFLAS